MCYTGMCAFENHMGDCRVKSFDEFKSELGENACIVGGMCFGGDEAEQYIEDNADKLAELKSEAYEKNLVW